MSVSQNIKSLLARYRDGQKSSPSLGRHLAAALEWTVGGARTEPLRVLGMSGEVTRGFVADQPATLFASGTTSSHLLGGAALYAYHASIEWGMVADLHQAIVFNSHWIRDGFWFHLPPIRWTNFRKQADILEALTPSGLTDGRIEEIAIRFYAPDSQLVQVDDALVDRLDHWRAETIRHASNLTDIDEKLHTLFAQLFVLRVVEDRKLAALPSLWSTVGPSSVDIQALRELYQSARLSIVSELFDVVNFEDFPPFILAGIIKDLYVPTHLPMSDTKYNFAWLDADILGRAYEKYLSTLLIPSSSLPPQLALWQQPLREVERVSVRKASGVYYTPSFLVRYLTEKCIDRYFATTPDPVKKLPKIADISCGSGSFLTTAVDSLIRRYKSIDAGQEWGRKFVQRNCVIGVDIDPRAVTFARLMIWLRLAQEPNPLPLPSLKKTIVQGDSLKNETWRELPAKYDIALGNPPFLSSGGMQSRAALAMRFKTAHGRFDYSYLFVEQALNKLKPSGVIGLVVPNRLFRNRDAAILRELITQECDLLTVIDFGSGEVFSGISSYTGALVAQKGRGAATNTIRAIQVLAMPKKLVGAVLARADRSGQEIKNQYIAAFDAQEPRGPDPWVLLSPSGRKARLLLESKAELLSSIAGIFQGIRTGANDVFIVELTSGASSGIVQVKNGLGDVHLIEQAVLRAVVFGSDIQRYDLINPRQFLVYPYELDRVISENRMKELFPAAFRYLTMYRDLLASRSSSIAAGQAWYELVRKRDEAWLTKRKLLIRDLATETSFALENVGGTYLVGGTAVVPDDPLLLLPLLSYLNSRIVNWYLNQMTPSFRAGFQKFEPQHLQRVPVPADLIEGMETRDRLTSLANSIIELKYSGKLAEQSRCEDEVDRLLCEMIGINLSDLN